MYRNTIRKSNALVPINLTQYDAIAAYNGQFSPDEDPLDYVRIRTVGAVRIA